MNSSSSVKIISDCFVKPRRAVEAAEHPIHLPPADLAMLSVHYMQNGLLFVKPQQAYDNPVPFMASFLETLKASLSLALVHFYPLAGRLKTLKSSDPLLYSVYIDSGETSPGSRFIYATLEATVSDILTPTYVPAVVNSLFDHDRAVNHDGHTVSLLSIQVTELVDGVFIGFSMNHAVGDGISFWNFLNAWSEIHRAGEGYDGTISRPPVLQRWFPENCNVPINLPFRDQTEFVSRFESPILLEKIFHFSPETIARLKSKANEECKTDEISSFQALTAFVWKSITRVRKFLINNTIITSCFTTADNRRRIKPALSPYYFGNSISGIMAFSATAEEVLRQGIGWVALNLHRGIAAHGDEEVSRWHEEWLRSPVVFDFRRASEQSNVVMGSSHRLNKYGVEFGLGKAVAVRSGYASKFDGKLLAHPGKEGGGSVDLEVCLSPEKMAALEADEEFMAAVVV